MAHRGALDTRGDISPSTGTPAGRRSAPRASHMFSDATTANSSRAALHDVVAFDPAKKSHLGFVAATHDAEPRRIVRSRENYLALLTLPKVSTTLALDGGEPAAYLVVGEGFNKPGLIEGGGDPAGLETLVRRSLDRAGAWTQHPGARPADDFPIGPADGGPQARRAAARRGGRRHRLPDDAGEQRRRADERHPRPSRQPVGGTRRRGVAVLPPTPANRSPWRSTAATSISAPARWPTTSS